MSGPATPLSLNEISFFFTRAAVGAGAPFGIGEDFAKAATWLAFFGADPAELAAPALSGLGTGGSSGRLTLLDARDAICVQGVNGEALSAIFAGPAVTDLVTVEAEKGTTRRIVLQKVDQPALIAAAVAAADIDADRIVVSWRASAGGEIVVEIANGRVEIADAGGSGLGAAEATDVEVVLNGRAALEGRTLSVTAADILERKARAPSDGVVVGDVPWSTVHGCFRKCLVPSNDTSRTAGAGAGLTDND